MRFVTFMHDGKARLGARRGEQIVDLSVAAPDLPATLAGLLKAGPAAMEKAKAAVAAATGNALHAADAVKLLPPIPEPAKIICIGLNYVDHAAESPYEGLPKLPVVFGRYANSLVAAGDPMIAPRNSAEFDWEGELVAVIGKTARHVSKDDALDYVAGYSVFNDGSIRDFQFHSHQWIVGKTFDGTGGFGPDFVTADELPAGAKGLRLVTRVNGAVMQDASTDDMIFDIATLVSYLSSAFTLSPGDVIVTGTPAGVGFARKPPVFLKAGDICEVEIEKVGLLRNPIIAEA